MREGGRNASHRMGRYQYMPHILPPRRSAFCGRERFFAIFTVFFAKNSKFF